MPAEPDDAPQPGTLEYAQWVAEEHGDLDDAAIEDGMDPQPEPVEPDTEELDALALLIDQHDNQWQHGVASDEQWNYRIARAVLSSGWRAVHDIELVAEERHAWVVATGDPTPAHARSTNDDIAASLAELAAQRDNAEAAIRRVRALCDKWDKMTKGKSPTTWQVRAAIDGKSEPKHATPMTAAEIQTRAAREVCPQTRFPDGTHCGEYGWHGVGCPEREVNQP